MRQWTESSLALQWGGSALTILALGPLICVTLPLLSLIFLTCDNTYGVRGSLEGDKVCKRPGTQLMLN